MNIFGITFLMFLAPLRRAPLSEKTFMITATKKNYSNAYLPFSLT